MLYENETLYNERIGTNVQRSARTNSIQIPDDVSTVESAAAARTAPEWNEWRKPFGGDPNTEPTLFRDSSWKDKSQLHAEPEVSLVVGAHWQAAMERAGFPLAYSPKLLSSISYISILLCFFSTIQLSRAFLFNPGFTCLFHWPVLGCHLPIKGTT